MGQQMKVGRLTLEMLPCSPFHDGANITDGDADICGDTCEALSGRGAVSDRDDLSICQARARTIFAAWVRRLTSFGTARISSWRKLPLLPSFLEHIGRVVFVGTKEQMVWVHAARIIALMANDHVFGNRPPMYLITETMGRVKLAVQFYLAILRRNPVPKPTFIRCAGRHMTAKSILWRARGVAMSWCKESDRLTNQPAPIWSRARCQSNGLAAPTLTLPIRKLQAVFVNPRGISLNRIERDGRVVHGDCTSNTVAHARATREVVPGASIHFFSPVYLKNPVISNLAERGGPSCAWVG